VAFKRLQEACWPSGGSNVEVLATLVAGERAQDLRARDLQQLGDLKQPDMDGVEAWSW
jgi:hypothetical protein